MSIKGQSFLTNLSSNRNDKKGERQEEKSRGRETWRLASAVPGLSALLAVFSRDIQSAENSRETNRSQQKTEQLCCREGQPATCLLFPGLLGIWGRALHAGQGGMRAGSCLCSVAPGASVCPAGAGHQYRLSPDVVSATSSSRSCEVSICAPPPPAPAQPIPQGQHYAGAPRGSHAPLLLLIWINDAFSICNSLFCPDRCPHGSAM